jgi:hypothetical protein
MKALLGLCAILVTGTIAHAAVWKATNTWDDHWEQEYGRWIQTEYNEDIYMTGKYKGIKQDCADAVYMSRLIFAYENKLPFVIGDSTGGKSKITNEMTRWDGKPELDRVRAMMGFIEWNVSTKTLPRDTYPVEISRKYVRPGAVWVRPSREVNKWNGFIATLTGKSVIVDPGHSEVIKEVFDNGSVRLIGSTTPAAVRRLTVSSSFLIMPESTDVGIRNWVRPDWYAKPRTSLPGYSLEQFEMGKGVTYNNNGNYGEGGGPIDDGTASKKNGSRSYRQWRQDIQDRLKQRDETPQEVVERFAADLCSLVASRAEIVTEAQGYKAKHPGCMNESAYDAYSTPTRDKRIKASIDEMTKAARGGFGFGRSLNDAQIQKALAACPAIQISPSKSVALKDLLENSSRFSSDPNDPVEARWGFGGGGSRCPDYK